MARVCWLMSVRRSKRLSGGRLTWWWMMKKSLSPSSTLHIIITQEEKQGSTSKEGGWVAAEDRFLISFQTHQGRCWSKGSGAHSGNQNHSSVGNIWDSPNLRSSGQYVALIKKIKEHLLHHYINIFIWLAPAFYSFTLSLLSIYQR